MTNYLIIMTNEGEKVFKPVNLNVALIKFLMFIKFRT